MQRGTTTEIYFRCTACRRRLAIDAAGAGRLVECPNCAASMLVPARSTIVPPQYTRFATIALAQVLALTVVAVAATWLWRDDAQATVEPLLPPAPSARALAQKEAALPAVATPATPVPAGALVLEKQNRDLQAANRAVSRQYEELANWVLTNMRGRYPLKDRLVSRLKFSPVTEEFVVHPDMADFLEADEREQGLMNDAFAYGWSTLAAIEAAHITASHPAPDRVTLHIPPFEQEGEAMRGDLYRALEAVLGRARFDKLIEVSEEDLVKSYHYFGMAARTMIFQLEPSGNAHEPPFLLIKDGWVIPGKEGTRSITATESATRELPAIYSAYLAWLPEFVTSYARP